MKYLVLFSLLYTTQVVRKISISKQWLRAENSFKKIFLAQKTQKYKKRCFFTIETFLLFSIISSKYVW